MKKKYIVRHSSRTYVHTHHPEGYFEDKYYGTVSVRGSERYDNHYPGKAWIEYNVQGDISYRSVSSTGQFDGSTRTNKITVYDKWNLGLATKVRGNVELYPATANPSSLPNR